MYDKGLKLHKWKVPLRFSMRLDWNRVEYNRIDQNRLDLILLSVQMPVQ